jgi:3'-5' exoribonuclease 1
MNYVIVDLEATCWEKGTPVDCTEIIEVGAVLLDGGNGLKVLKEFDSFVHPPVHPVLSEFCKRLTAISQQDVDAALPFAPVFEEFVGWIGGDRHIFCSWGNYDLRQIQVECKRNQIALPGAFKQGINLKGEFAAFRKVRPCGFIQAMRILHIPAIGVHHRGIDDARNIARIAEWLLPRIGH